MKVIQTWAIVDGEIIQFLGTFEEAEVKNEEINGEIKSGYAIVDEDNGFLVDNLFDDEDDAVDFLENGMN